LTLSNACACLSKGDPPVSKVWLGRHPPFGAIYCHQGTDPPPPFFSDDIAIGFRRGRVELFPLQTVARLPLSVRFFLSSSFQSPFSLFWRDMMEVESSPLSLAFTSFLSAGERLPPSVITKLFAPPIDGTVGYHWIPYHFGVVFLRDGFNYSSSPPLLLLLGLDSALSPSGQERLRILLFFGVCGRLFNMVGRMLLNSIR